MSNMYDILGKLKNLLPGQDKAVEVASEPIYESVEAKGDIMEAVKSLEEKYMGFKKTVAAIKKGGSAENPEAVAASIGRKKYGKKKFQKAAATGKNLGEAAKPDFLDVDKDGNKKETFKKAVKDKEAVKESADPKAQKGAQAILQALSPEEEQELAGIVKQAGNDPKRVAQALGITPQSIQQATQGQVAEGIAPDLTGKIIQALWTAGLVGGVAAGLGGHEIISANLMAPILMAAGAVWGEEPGQNGHNPNKSVNEVFSDEERKAQRDATIERNYQAKRDANTKKYEKNKKAAEKRAQERARAKVAEGEYEPEAPNADAIAKRKRLQAIKDRQEDERGYGAEKNTPIRKIAGKAYGGSAQKDAPEVDDLAEKAPPGAKAERMVKHIKKGYSKDGALTKKEKGIAYATAWKAHNKGQVEEGVKFGDTIKNSKAELKKAKPAKLKESRMIQEGDYFYETIGKALAEKNPTLDTASPDFIGALRQEMIAQGIKPNQARNIIMTDEDFIMDVATSYGHYVKEIAECGAPINSHLGGGMEELDEIARLAGVQREGNAFTGKLAQTAKGGTFELDGKEFTDTSSLGEADVDEGNEYTKARLDAIRAGKDVFTVGGKAHKVSGDTSQERVQVESQVNEDVTISVTATLEDDAVNMIRRLAGMDIQQPAVMPAVDPSMIAQPLAQPDVAVDTVDAEPAGAAPADGEQEVEEDRDIEYVNTPREKTAPVSAVTPSGNDLHKSKQQDPRTANKAANPLRDTELEENLWKAYEDMISDVKQ